MAYLVNPPAEWRVGDMLVHPMRTWQVVAISATKDRGSLRVISGVDSTYRVGSVHGLSLKGDGWVYPYVHHPACPEDVRVPEGL